MEIVVVGLFFKGPRPVDFLPKKQLSLTLIKFKTGGADQTLDMSLATRLRGVRKSKQFFNLI
ncbi:MAG: hypothetical protein CL915_04705 [Deltaproteobacteria bacterium]|nr:hypothetical protein [Deltaproteobacteria bacterium]